LGSQAIAWAEALQIAESCRQRSRDFSMKRLQPHQP
jgi:hypothetical protein